MFIAMNTFQVAPGKGEDFERIWAERETHLYQVPGFVRFALLRGDAEGVYVSHSTWMTAARSSPGPRVTRSRRATPAPR